MLCRNCDRFDTVPGIKWGVCDRRRRTSNNTKDLVKGPDTVCNYTNDCEEPDCGEEDM